MSRPKSQIDSISNPLGILAIDHLEFCTDDLNLEISELFYNLGFEKTHRSNNGQAELYTQGQIRFLLSLEAKEYLAKHGKGVSKISFIVEDAKAAYQHVKSKEVNPVVPLTIDGQFLSFAIQGFGDVINEFIERPMAEFRPHFKKLLASDPKYKPLAVRFSRIDHLTNNVPFGEIDRWVKFYGDIFGMKVTRYFDIRGMKSALKSEVVQLENKQVIIPINAPVEQNSHSQIQEFLDLHSGAGVQHIALMSSDVKQSVLELQQRGIQFLAIPDTYYQNIPQRKLNHKEDLVQLAKRQLLIDGDESGYLLQNFTNTYIGPLFFETIERVKHWGFGEGNFQALFDSIEQDQIKRGYIK